MLIRDFRIKLGLTQSEFAEKYHITKCTLANWEQGVSPVPEYFMRLLLYSYAMEKELGVPLDSMQITEEDGLSKVTFDYSDTYIAENMSFDIYTSDNARIRKTKKRLAAYQTCLEKSGVKSKDLTEKSEGEE